MADFDTNIIVKLLDQVTAPARQVTAALQQVQQQANALALYRADRGFLYGFVDEARRSWPQIKQYYSEGWARIKAGATQAYTDLTGILSAIWSVFRRFSFYTGLTIAGVGYMFNSWARGIQQQEQYATALGFSAERLRALQFAAKSAGMTQGEFTTGMEQFVAQLGMARERTGTLYEFLSKRAGVSGRALLQDMLAQGVTPEQAALRYIEEIGRRQPSSGMMAARAGFGRGGAGFYTLGTTNFAERMAEYEKLYPEMTAQEKKGIEEYVRQTERLSTAWDNMKRTLFGPFLKPVTEALDGISKWMADPKNQRWVSDEAVYMAGQLLAAFRYIRDIDWAGWKTSFDESVVKPIKGIKDFLGGWDAVGVALGSLVLAGPAYEILAGIGTLLIPGGPLLLGLGLLGAAGYAIWYNWDVIAPLLKDVNTAWKELTGHDVAAELKSFVDPMEQWKRVTGELNGLVTTLRNLIEKPLDWGTWKSIVGLPPQVKRYLTNKGLLPGAYTQHAGPYGPGRPASAYSQHASPYGPFIPRSIGPTGPAPGPGIDWGSWLPSMIPSTVMPGARGAGQGAMPSGPSIGDWFSQFSPIGSAGAAERSITPTPFRVPSGPAWAPESPSGLFGMAGGTPFYGALQGAMADLVGSKAGALGANAPITGMPPTGITIQARGPSVNISQAPPNVNIAVTVNVMKPDEAPIATATAVGDALGRQARGTPLFDGTTEA